MAAPSERIARRVAADFGEAPGAVLERLEAIPERLPGAGSQDAERLHASLVVGAASNPGRLTELIELAQIDFRDLLASTGFAAADWPARLDAELGPR